MAEESIVCCRCGGTVERGSKTAWYRAAPGAWRPLAINVCVREECVREEVLIHEGAQFVHKIRVVQRAGRDPGIRKDIIEIQQRYNTVTLPDYFVEALEECTIEVLVREQPPRGEVTPTLTYPWRWPELLPPFPEVSAKNVDLCECGRVAPKGTWERWNNDPLCPQCLAEHRREIAERLYLRGETFRGLGWRDWQP